MVTNIAHAKKVHARRVASGKSGIGKAVRRFIKRANINSAVIAG